jgi:glycosyltransferase involved in cell wall biosynthesis
MKLSIIIPVYNEEKTIHLILDKVLNVQLINQIHKEIILVNDCSKDDSKGAINQYITNIRENKPEYNDIEIKYYEQPVNMGKGAALHRGFNEEQVIM